MLCYPNYLFMSFGERYLLFDDAKVRRTEQYSKKILVFRRKSVEKLINIKLVCACTVAI